MNPDTVPSTYAHELSFNFHRTLRILPPSPFYTKKRGKQRIVRPHPRWTVSKCQRQFGLPFPESTQPRPQQRWWESGSNPRASPLLVGITWGPPPWKTIPIITLWNWTSADLTTSRSVSKRSFSGDIWKPFKAPWFVLEKSKNWKKCQSMRKWVNCDIFLPENTLQWWKWANYSSMQKGWWIVDVRAKQRGKNKIL